LQHITGDGHFDLSWQILDEPRGFALMAVLNDDRMDRRTFHLPQCLFLAERGGPRTAARMVSNSQDLNSCSDAKVSKGDGFLQLGSGERSGAVQDGQVCTGGAPISAGRSKPSLWLGSSHLLRSRYMSQANHTD